MYTCPCACVSMCVCVCPCLCVYKSSRGRSSENVSVSAPGRNSNPLICLTESPASQLSLCLWHPTQPLAPPPAPFEDSYPGNWKLFSKRRQERGERSADTAKREKKEVCEKSDGEAAGQKRGGGWDVCRSNQFIFFFILNKSLQWRGILMRHHHLWWLCPTGHFHTDLI